MKVYQTKNSSYTIDEDNMRYMRNAGDLVQSVLSHRLTYGEWHPLKAVPHLTADGTLHILRDDSMFGIFTTEVVSQYEV